MIDGDNIQPTIIIPAYNRPHSLQRLLNSLAQSNYVGYKNIQLIISVDYSGSSETAKIAEQFIWQFGNKKVIKHQTNLGLKKNVLFCINLIEEYQTVIILEDDLFVAPNFYNYACQAVKFYQSCPEIAGISLYSYHHNEYAQVRFMPLDDGFDNYFIQSVTSWGQLWTKHQWQEFKSWCAASGDISIDGNDPLPDVVINRWSNQSWKKYFIKYMVLTNKYFVVPRVSLTTNFGELGKHLYLPTYNLQVPLIMGQKYWHFSYIYQSQAIYDCHYEITASCLKKANSFLKDFDFECDLYGTKNMSKIKSEYIITLRKSDRPIESYGLTIIPQELNLALSLPGNFFHLTKPEDCQKISMIKKLEQYLSLHQDAGIKRFFLLSIYKIIKRMQFKLNRHG